jgi:hypothetical protein
MTMGMLASALLLTLQQEWGKKLRRQTCSNGHRRRLCRGPSREPAETATGELTAPPLRHCCNGRGAGTRRGRQPLDLGCLQLPGAEGQPGWRDHHRRGERPGLLFWGWRSGHGSHARLAWGLAVDAAGDLFIAETGGPYDPGGAIAGNGRVRKVGRDGIITTVAGTGKPGFSGEGGKATEAQLNLPVALAVDSVGNLFIADEGNYRVRKVSPEGIITTVAGNGKHAYAGDGGLATETGLRGPSALAIDAAGNLLIANRRPGWAETGGLPEDDRIVKVFGVAAPGLLAGVTFPR